MSKRVSKFIKKAKSKLVMCTKINETTFSDYLSELPRTPVKFLPQKTFASKKKTPRTNVINKYSSSDETVMNISQFPLLVATPELKRAKVSSTFIERELVETILTEDLSIRSPSLSGIKEIEYDIDDLISEDESFSHSASAFSNHLYDSPVLQRFDINKTLTRFTSCNSTRFSNVFQDSFGFKSTDFKSVCSEFFDSNEQNEIFV